MTTINEMNIQILSDFVDLSEKKKEMNDKINEIMPLLDKYSQKCFINGNDNYE